MAAHESDRLEPAHYGEILEGIQEAVIVTGADGRLMYMNPAAIELRILKKLDLPPGESLDLRDYILENIALRTPDGDPVAPEDRPLARALRGETFQNEKLLVQHKDQDDPRMYAFSGTRIRNDPTMGVLTIRNETDYWRADRRYRVAFDTDPAPTLIARLDDNRILQANSGMAELTGLTLDELSERSLADLKLLEHNGDLENVSDVLRRGERIHKVQTRLFKADGSDLDVLVSARAIEIDEQPAGIFTFLDISDLETARRKAERTQAELAKQREREKLQAERARAQSLLAAKIDKERIRMAQDLHDGVLQNLLALSTDLAIDEQEHRHADNVAIAEALRHYRERVLLNVMQLRRDIRGFRPASLRMLGLWGSLRETLPDRSRPGTPEVALPSEHHPDLPESTLLVLYRVAQEAIQNAVKHAQATRVEVALDVGEHEVVMRVTDNGKGFDVPLQLSEFAQENHFGLLGMREHALAKRGTLEIDSTPGEGTQIVLRLPTNVSG